MTQQLVMEPRRDRWGRYLITPADGGEPKAHTRATTVASTLDDRFALEKWGKRTMLKGLVGRPDLFAAGAAAPDDDKRKLDDICAQAVEAGGASSSATLGSALHQFTERIDRGEEVTVPPPWDSDVEAYLAALAAAGVKVLPDLIERTVVCDSLSEPIAGTFDRILDVGGQLTISDLKTGQSLDFAWLSIAIQLAIYAHAATLYDHATGTHEPMPHVDRRWGLVIHLPVGQGTCTLYRVDLEAGWRAARVATSVRDWRKTKKLSTVVTPDELNITAKRRVWVAERVAYLRENHPDALATVARNWPAGTPTLKQSTAHNAVQLAAIVRVVMDAEKEHEVEFPAVGEPGAVEPKKPAKSAAHRTGRSNARIPVG